MMNRTLPRLPKEEASLRHGLKEFLGYKLVPDPAFLRRGRTAKRIITLQPVGGRGALPLFYGKDRTGFTALLGPRVLIITTYVDYSLSKACPRHFMKMDTGILFTRRTAARTS